MVEQILGCARLHPGHQGKEKTVPTAAVFSRSRDVNVYYSTLLFSVVAIVGHGFV